MEKTQISPPPILQGTDHANDNFILKLVKQENSLSLF